MVLNELTPGLKGKVAPTDCRLRPDQYYMEIGEFDKVSVMQLGDKCKLKMADESNC